MPISVKISENTLSPSELARLSKRDQLRNEGRTTSCDFFASPLKVKPDWAY